MSTDRRRQADFRTHPAATNPLSEWPTYTATLCPIRRGGAASHSRPHPIILHNESGDGKPFFLHLIGSF
jgi:hypothetical protein